MVTTFTLETNGTKTATTFDYESNASTYNIRVQARDELVPMPGTSPFLPMNMSDKSNHSVLGFRYGNDLGGARLLQWVVHYPKRGDPQVRPRILCYLTCVLSGEI